MTSFDPKPHVQVVDDDIIVTLLGTDYSVTYYRLESSLGLLETRQCVEKAGPLGELKVRPLEPFPPSIDMSSRTGKLVMGVLALIAEFENDIRHERQMDGIAKARQRGVSGDGVGAAMPFAHQPGAGLEAEAGIVGHRARGPEHKRLQLATRRLAESPVFDFLMPGAITSASDRRPFARGHKPT